MRKAIAADSAPIIKPQPKVQFQQINFKIDLPTLDKLQSYSEFIGSEQGYIIREALNYLFQSDLAFQRYLETSTRTVESRTEPEDFSGISTK